MSGMAEPESSIEDALLGALGEEVGEIPEPPAAVEQPVEVEDEEDPGEEPEEEAEEEVVATSEDEPEEHPEDGEPSGDETVDLSGSTADPEIIDLLSRYSDVEAALKGQVELQRLVSRQGAEKRQLQAQVEQLQAQVTQAQMFSQHGPSMLDEQQRGWVEEAVQSEQPLAYIHSAVQAGQFDLARAIVEEWGSENPFQAIRAAQLIDAAEYQAMEAQQQYATPAFAQSSFFDQLTSMYPDMPQHQEQMLLTLKGLGDEHPLVIAARSADMNEAARGVIGIYEIAKAQNATLRSTRETVKKREKEAGARARQAAVVSSAQSTAAAPQAPRQQEIVPGLTWEQYMDELDK